MQKLGMILFFFFLEPQLIGLSTSTLVLLQFILHVATRDIFLKYKSHYIIPLTRVKLHAYTGSIYPWIIRLLPAFPGPRESITILYFWVSATKDLLSVCRIHDAPFGLRTLMYSILLSGTFSALWSPLIWSSLGYNSHVTSSGIPVPFGSHPTPHTHPDTLDQVPLIPNILVHRYLHIV